MRGLVQQTYEGNQHAVIQVRAANTKPDGSEDMYITQNYTTPSGIPAIDSQPFAPSGSIPCMDSEINRAYWEAGARSDPHVKLHLVTFAGLPPRIFSIRSSNANTRDFWCVSRASETVAVRRSLMMLRYSRQQRGGNWLEHLHIVFLFNES
ncbi:hypothetical protein C8R43DRAFT_557156 [Mycena crocata]|nr:hypothetical protein C8R43DRAFT_557156 [Mycena crocata]